MQLIMSKKTHSKNNAPLDRPQHKYNSVCQHKFVVMNSKNSKIRFCFGILLLATNQYLICKFPEKIYLD